MGLYLCYIKHLFFYIVGRLSIIQYNCFMRFFFDSLREILVLDIASRIRVCVVSVSNRLGFRINWYQS
ncbi:hypothetical protein MANES_09G076452v8 [Manihot esculenta]|uniref:Uncharacterized protein n=1 Tax=Manihot esculenta TaxID=3983 RepID=A0ACB7H5P0_MANES|nr:hypothetical protein MANES_09G076452v8 [Manihot esculenta]